jgi:hypothetical protein
MMATTHSTEAISANKIPIGSGVNTMASPGMTSPITRLVDWPLTKACVRKPTQTTSSSAAMNPIVSRRLGFLSARKIPTTASVGIIRHSISR